MAGGKLTARKVETAKPGRYGDGHGLWLVVSPTGAAKWVYRYARNGKPTEMGLGPTHTVSLAEARLKALECRKQRLEGVDPIQSRRDKKAHEQRRKTFGEVADAYVAAKEGGWKNDKHRAQWRMTLEVYAAPLRSRSVDQIETTDVLAVLKPLWQTKPETASRLRGRIEAILDAAKAQGLRSGDNAAAWKGNLQNLLSDRRKGVRGHHAALDYRELPSFMVKLRQLESTSALALELCILTATRSGEVLGARWDEVNFDDKVWTVPASRMKSKREHKIPLSTSALAILQKLAKARSGDFIFAGQRSNSPLSSMAMAMSLRRMGETCTVHGFRSAFRDWAGDRTHFPREVAEAALAHRVGDETERAYRRGSALEKRRELMELWDRYF